MLVRVDALKEVVLLETEAYQLFEDGLIDRDLG